MRILARVVIGAACIALLPNVASAQTSGIAGTVRDASGAVLPGVTVEAASPALIEKVRSATTDGSGQFKITTLRTGTYTVTFTLPGFSVVKRENVELTSDFTATINADMKVGAVEETITVSAQSPIVDTQSITTRTVMTREVMDAIPTGKNIQAVGIMIPGTSISLGGGGALSRDVGGSGGLQQSPLQYRGSADTVQTVEGMRLNNLCANGAYSGVYWNDGSFQEFSYVTGADSAEMGQGGMRVNMVPKDGGNSFHGTVVGNYTPSAWASDNCGSAGPGKPCTSSNLTGDTTFNKTNNYLTNVSQLTSNYDFNPSFGGPIYRDKAWFFTRVPISRGQQDGGGQLLQPELVPVHLRSQFLTAWHRRWSYPQHHGAGHRAGDRTRTRFRTTTTIRTRSADTGGSRRPSRRKRRRFRRHRPVSCRSPNGPGRSRTNCCSTQDSRSTTRSIRRTTSPECSRPVPTW